MKFIGRCVAVICVLGTSSALTFTGIKPKDTKLPAILKTCHKSDPKVNDCIKQSIEQLRPYLVQGIPELSVPPCEPLFIPEVVMNQGKGSVAVQSTYSNIKIYGPSQFVLKNVKVDFERDRLRLKVWLPFLHMSSDYTIDGRILMLPISGKGYSEGNYTDIEATAIIQGEKIHVDGKTYLNVVDFFCDFNIGHASVYLSDLFNGDKELGDAMNLFLNDNWRNVAQEIKPVLEETIGNLFKKFANKIFHKYPLDEILPP